MNTSAFCQLLWRCRRACLAVALCALAAFPPGLAAQVNVTQHHNQLSRDGLYVDPAFTFSAAINLKRNLSFNGTIVGEVYAQPLYLDSGPNGKAAVIVVTESNNVYALDAIAGSILWQTNVGPAVPISNLPCGNVNPVGILGTPAVDLDARTLCFDSLTTQTGTVKHLIYALDLDNGAVKSGWPVEVDTTAKFGGVTFSSAAQGQRGALCIVDGILYVPYGGNFGDCGTYNGWVVGVPLNSPSNVVAWATSANGGGIWGVGGIASDGTNLFVSTGNTFNASVWGGGEAVIRLQPGPVFSQKTNDYWAATNWQSLDAADLDIGSSGPLLVHVPGASPPDLVVAMGKDTNVYLLNYTNLGGVSPPLAKTHFSSASLIIQAAASYQTTQGTYVVFAANSNLNCLRIGATAPLSIISAWTEAENGRGSPFVTSTDGTNNMIVWGIGCEGDQRLHGFNAETGAAVFAGGGANELMANTRRFNTAVVAHGHIYFAADNKVYSFTVPVQSIVLTNVGLSSSNAFQCQFGNISGATFTAYGTTNPSLPYNAWLQVGAVQEVTPGCYQFTDSQVRTNKAFFYRIESP